jgi:nucleotide-binding universal stress UspA family protein
MPVETSPVVTFHSVLCGIDGSNADAAAVRQAAILAGPSARLELLSITRETPSNATVRPQLTRREATRALRNARATAVDYGAHPVERMVDGASDADGIMDAARDHDLLVVGPPEEGRLLGVLVGAVTTHAAHKLPCPLLVSRRSPDFPNPILLADDGTEVSGEAVRIAAALAAQHGADVVLAAPVLYGAANRDRLGRHAATIKLQTGREPALATVDEPPSRSIPALAHELGSGLIVMGSSRRHGLKSLACVSERVAHRAACPVLIVPGS